MKGEDKEQAQLFVDINRYLRGKYPEVDLLFAIPNGGKRHVAVAAKLKKTGVKAGVPDLFLPVARNEYHGLFIEMKDARKRSKKTGKLLAGKRARKSQQDWLDALKAEGYKAVVCHGAGDAFKVIEKYLKSID